MKHIITLLLAFSLLFSLTACSLLAAYVKQAEPSTPENTASQPETEPEEPSYHALSRLPEIDYNTNTVAFVLEENHATPYLWEQRILYGESCLALTEDYTVKEEHLLPSLSAGVAAAYHRFTYTWQTDGEACVVLTEMRVEGYRDGPDDFLRQRVFLLSRFNDDVTAVEAPEEEAANILARYW